MQDDPPGWLARLLGYRIVRIEPSDEQPDVAGDVDNPIIARDATSAWLTAFFASPAGHRTNAQSGYTIAAAVATAIVAAGLLTSIDEAPLWIAALLTAALALWLRAAWFFMRTVAFQPTLRRVDTDGTAKALATDAIARTRAERSVIAQRSWRAQKAARWAGIVTFIALVLLVLRPSIAQVDATVDLTPDGSDHVQALCGMKTKDPLTARVDPTALDDSVVVLYEVSCDGESRTLRLPKADIAGAATNAGKWWSRER